MCSNGVQAVHCFSALNGHYFGATSLEDYSEPEAVVIRHWQLAGVPTTVHILELNNDIEDDCYLHSWVVPGPDHL